MNTEEITLTIGMRFRAGSVCFVIVGKKESSEDIWLVTSSVPGAWQRARNLSPKEMSTAQICKIIDDHRADNAIRTFKTVGCRPGERTRPKQSRMIGSSVT